jgi:hypothetical protein
MIIQTAPSDTPRLAIMMYEHTALCLQLAHAFGNQRFEPLAPADQSRRGVVRFRPEPGD